MKQEQISYSDTKYNQLQTDFRVEAVAANILKFYNPDANIVIKRIGLNDRAYLKDIKQIDTHHHTLDDEDVVIETYREGIYDYMPEGIFHPPSLGISSKNVDSVVREMRKQKLIEDDARKFFQPFELEFFYTHVSALLKESEFDSASKTDSMLDFAIELWPVLQKMEPESAKILINVLPFMHEVRGNKTWIEKFLNAFLKVPVEITFVPNKIAAQDDVEGITALGNARLGITLIPMGKHMDGDRNWEINIGTIPYEELHRYVPGSHFRKLLTEIYDFFIPVSVKVFEKFITEKVPTSFVINSGKETSRLGYSTFI